MKAIRQLGEHELLRYTWMRYLPRRGENNTWDAFWLTLVDGIGARIKEESVVRTRGMGALRRIRELMEPLQICYDCHGSPLFRDLEPEVYISGSYQQSDLAILRHFGLRLLSMDTVLLLVRWDLGHPSGHSRFASLDTEEDWHTRASALLLLPWENDWEPQQAELRTLPLIPLNNGLWRRSVDEGEVFYDTVGDTPIPKDLGLNLVDPRAARNEKRRALFDHLGVKQASTHLIRSLILTVYAQRGMGYITIEDSLEHLKFLYHTHHSRPKDEPTTGISVYDHFNILRHTLEYDLYVKDDDPYGAHRLLGSSSGFPSETLFVNPKYFVSSPTTPLGTDLTWTKWIYDYVGVRHKIRLLSPGGTSLSEECKHIAKHHSDRFLGFLKHVWSDQGQGIANNVAAIAELQRLRVPCTNGKMVPLSRCYIPLEELKNVCWRFTSSKVMRFLNISPLDANSLFSEWWFLPAVLGVAYKDDLNFRLDLIEAFLDSAMPSLTTEQALKVLELYQYIDTWCVGAENPEAAREHVRSVPLLDGLIPSPSPARSLFQLTFTPPRI